MTTSRTFTVLEHVVFGSGVVWIVVEHHHLIGEEFFLGGAHGLPATATQDNDEEE